MLFRQGNEAEREIEMLELNHRTEMARQAEMPKPASQGNKQNFRLITALSLLIVALTVVLVKDRDFWFGSEQANESFVAPQNVANTTKSAAPAKVVTAPAAKSAIVKHNSVAKSSQTASVASVHQDAVEQTSPVIATSRVILPPLDVEVVAGDSHRTVRSGSNATKVEIPATSKSAFAESASLPANAAERERISAVSAPELQTTADATYPLLGQHSKVQGSVVLQAVIGADGSIENLRVISGPAILATAAQQAVRQWRFKPYLQNGLPVETKTNITVNFSIRVADNPATT
jgi:TonB family protein